MCTNTFYLYFLSDCVKRRVMFYNSMYVCMYVYPFLWARPTPKLLEWTDIDM